MKKENEDAAKKAGLAGVVVVGGAIALHMVFWPAAIVTVPAAATAVFIHQRKKNKKNGPQL